tara:strand:+ start:79 stop:489 length:411 start_codon:yes stop_codon:yes gene_type:complete
MDRRTRDRLYRRCRRAGIWWKNGGPLIEIDSAKISDALERHTQRGKMGLQVLPHGGVRALLLDSKMNPIGLRVMRDIRAGVDRSSFDAFVDTARGRVDGKHRFTGRLIKLSVEIWNSREGLKTLPLIGIVSERDLE